MLAYSCFQSFYFLNFLSEYCPIKYEITIGISEKAIYFSKIPYSDRKTNIVVANSIKIKSNAFFFVFILFGFE